MADAKTRCKIIVVPYANQDEKMVEDIINEQLEKIGSDVDEGSTVTIGDKVALDERRIAVFYTVTTA